MSIHQQSATRDPEGGYGRRFAWLYDTATGEDYWGCRVCEGDALLVEGEERCTGFCADAVTLCPVCGEYPCPDNCEGE